MSRRTRAVGTSGIRRAAIYGVDEVKWGLFVQRSGSEGVTLNRYYLDKPEEDLIASDYEKVVTELFADMIAVKAIILPRLYAAADFQFEIVSVQGYDTMQISLNGKRVAHVPGLKIDLGPDGDLAGRDVWNGMGRIMRALREAGDEERIPLS
jgi:hypothetical protein